MCAVKECAVVKERSVVKERAVIKGDGMEMLATSLRLANTCALGLGLGLGLATSRGWKPLATVYLASAHSSCMRAPRTNRKRVKLLTSHPSEERETADFSTTQHGTKFNP